MTTSIAARFVANFAGLLTFVVLLWALHAMAGG